MTDAAFRYAVTSGQHFAWFSRNADRANGVVRKQRHSILFAAYIPTATAVAAFLNTINHVVSMRPEKQMIGIRAGGIVASVANKISRRYFSTVDFVRKPMG